MESPQFYNVPHSEWRPHQLETVKWTLDIDNIGVVEQPTGSGKSAVACAVSSKRSVIALVKTKSLQKQYESLYDARILFGRGNYPCLHPDYQGLTCADCPFESKMYRCPHANKCEYLLRKSCVIASRFASLNYSYWMSARSFRENHYPQCLFLDEAHNLSNVTTSFCSCTVTDRERVEWQLPSFPVIEHRFPNILLKLPPPVDLAIPWLQDARDVMVKHYRQLQQDARHNKKARERLHEAENLGRKLRSCLDALRLNSDEWYIRSGTSGLKRGYKTIPGITVKPLTAKHDFQRLFLNGNPIIAMSATIGQPETFAKELGIIGYQFRVVPSRFQPERRPVHVLDCPAMSSKATELDFEHQADAIAKFIKQYPSDWCGLIHVSRIREEKLLHDRLARRGLASRVFYIKSKQEYYTPTDKQLKAWERRKQRGPGALLITCSFGEGFDGLIERINISAKIPFPLLGSPESYDRAWKEYSPPRYNQKAAIALMQAQGRNRRGREVDYDTSNEARGANAVADGSLSRVESYLSESFREALVE